MLNLQTTLSLCLALATGVAGQCNPVTCPKIEQESVALERYYSSTSGLSGKDLKAELNTIIKDHERYSYNCVWVALAETDEDEKNPENVIAIYTQRSIPKLRRDCGGASIGTLNDTWNREHIWAKSHGFPNQRQHAHTDFHHLRPADKSVNSDRSNYDFQTGGTPNGECTECKEGDGTWEPPDKVKGEIARMMFYMAVRYEGNDDSETPDLELVDRATGKDPNFGYLSTLLEWHCKFPVSDSERRRNDKVHSWQGNRNFAIDRPEFVESIWNFECPEDTNNDSEAEAAKKAKAEEEARLAAETEALEKAKAEEEARLAAEKAKAKEEARLAAEKAKVKEEARLAAEKAKAKEEARLAAEKAKVEEEARLAEVKAKAEEAARLAEEKAKAEEAVRLAGEKAKAEEAVRLAEEEAKAEEEARLAEEKAKAEEEGKRMKRILSAIRRFFANLFGRDKEL